MSKSGPELRLLGVDFGDPWSIQTFSGSSRFIWDEFRRKNALAAVFTPYPGRVLTTYFKLRSFRPNVRRWRAAWRGSIAFRWHLSRRARRRIFRDFNYRCDALLQIGAYYDLSSSFTGIKTLLADNNCAIAQRTNPSFRSSERAYRLQFEFEQSVYQSMDRVFCFSRFLADSMVADFGCDPTRVKVVNAGINIDHNLIHNPTRDYRNKTILFVGFDWVNKGGPTLLEAFKSVRRLEPEARLELIGPALSSLPEGVVSHGSLSKDDPEQLETIARAFRSASVLVLPTLADAFPNVIREAMAAGLPCVASDIGAIPEMVQDGTTGLLVPTNNPRVLSDRLLTLICNPELAAEMGRAGYVAYRERFTWSRVCNTVLSEIRELVGRSNPGD